jgi:hypothetical protein
MHKKTSSRLTIVHRTAMMQGTPSMTMMQGTPSMTNRGNDASAPKLGIILAPTTLAM